MISGGWRLSRVVLAAMGMGIFPLAAVADRTLATAQAAPMIPENVPGPISYQGRLLDGSGAPVTTNVRITFTLYSGAQQGATQLWNQIVSSVALTPNGYFSQVLGDTVLTAIPSSVWNGQPVFIGITVGSDNEMSPRTPIYSVPYALLAPPTAHAGNHQYGGGDEVATAIPAANAIPLSRASGTLDPAWLPPATNSSPGAVPALPSGASSFVYNNDVHLSDKRAPTAHASSHLLNGADPLGALLPSAGVSQVPFSDPTTGLIDLSWISTSTVVKAKSVPISSANSSGGANPLDISWIPVSSTSRASVVPVSSGGALDISWIPVSSTAQASMVPVSSGSALDISWIPASTTPRANTVPVGSGAANTLDPSWIGTLPPTNGGTGSTAPKITRNLCIFLAGPAPTSNSVAPTLPLQPFSSCTATGAYGSAPGNPSGSISVFQGTNSAPMFTGNVSGGAFSMGVGPATASIGAGSFLYAISTSGSPSNVTVCVTVTCPAVF
jgi:hypothetical protein